MQNCSIYLQEIKNINKAFNCKTNSWYIHQKVKSPIILSLIELSDRLALRDITLNQVITILCTLYNSNTNKTYNSVNNYMQTIPDRLVCYRAQLSRNKLTYILKLLRNNCDNFIKIKKYKGQFSYKFTKLFYDDNYMNMQSNVFFKSDIKMLQVLIDNKLSMYYDRYTTQTMNKNNNANLLAIMIAYKNIFGDGYNTSERNQLISTKGERQDIVYLECPAHLVSYVSDMNEYDIRMTLNRLCNYTNYLASHNKVYLNPISGVTEWMKKNYNKNVSLLNRNECYIADSHNKVSEWSYILFTENFNSTKMHSLVNKRISKYEKLLKFAVKSFNKDLENNTKLNSNNTFENNLSELEFVSKWYDKTTYETFKSAEMIEDDNTFNNRTRTFIDTDDEESINYAQKQALVNEICISESGFHSTVIKNKTAMLREDAKKQFYPKIIKWEKLLKLYNVYKDKNKLADFRKLCKVQINKVLQFFNVREIIPDGDLKRYSEYVSNVTMLCD